MLLVISGPIAGGKSTLARAIAQEFERRGANAAAIDLDLLYEMLEHEEREKTDPRKWSEARRLAAALVDTLLREDNTVVIVEGDFLAPSARADFQDSLQTSVEPLFVTLRVSLDAALARVRAETTRGMSRDPGFLRRHFEEVAPSLASPPAGDFVVDTEAMTAAEAAAAVTAWALHHQQVG